jgi:hypothetical protein
MRVELLYAPGCLVSRRALDSLQTIIAEEGLPLPVEMTETTGNSVIKIDGDEIACGSHIEQLRALMSKKWMEHALPAYSA